MKSTATLLKKPPNLLRKDSWTKQFSGNHQDNGTSSAKHLLQSPFFLLGNNLSFKLKLYYNVQDLNCRPKILQQRDSKTDFLSKNFLEFLRKSLVEHAYWWGEKHPLFMRVFFTKFEDHNCLFQTSYFSL